MEFSTFAEALEIGLNVLETFVLGGSALIFIMLQSRFSKALKSILEPCGLDFTAKIFIIIACRKSLNAKRAFIEFAILETKGEPTIKGRWREIINKFKSWYRDQDVPSYHAENCTALLGTEFSDVIARYFDFFEQPKNRKAFGILDHKIKWLTTISLEEAYLTPSCLLMGLLSQYEENWSEFIKRYIATVFITDSDKNNANDILSEEIYLTFAWLLWGPSYELNYKHYWAGLCQISYGDESNSVPAIANPAGNIQTQLVEIFKKSEGNHFGALASVELSVYKNKSYYSHLLHTVSHDNLYFYEKIESGENSFALQIDDYSLHGGYKVDKYYCTAYVWVLFEIEDKNSSVFRPEKTVAFFEHANLTDKRPYQFLIETLIDKSIKHFEHIFSNEKLNGRCYRFVCCLNDYITQQVIRRYNERMNSDDKLAKEFRERIFLEPTHSPTEAFSAYDNFFTSNQELSFEEVSFCDKSSIGDLGQFYTSIYMECFPNKDERETFDNLLYYLKQNEEATDYNYHIILAKNENNEIVGGCIFDFFHKTNSAIIEFIAVKNELQSSGFGSLIFKQVLNIILPNDARSIGKKNIDYIFLEMDNPELSPSENKKYLHFWNKNQFKRIDFNYIQPSLSLNQDEVDSLWFAVVSFKTAEKESHAHDSIESKIVMDVIGDYMRYSMQIPNPEENLAYKKMHEEIRSKKFVPLKSLKMQIQGK